MCVTVIVGIGGGGGEARKTIVIKVTRTNISSTPDSTDIF